MVKEPPEATATPEPLSDEDLALDPDLYQDFCAGAFDDHGLVSNGSSCGGGRRGEGEVTEWEGGAEGGRAAWEMSR